MLSLKNAGTFVNFLKSRDKSKKKTTEYFFYHKLDLLGSEHQNLVVANDKSISKKIPLLNQNHHKQFYIKIHSHQHK